MMKLLAVATCAAATELGVTPADYERYKQQFTKTYPDPEEDERFELFKESVHRINEANAKNGKVAFGWTWTTDLRAEEKASTGYRRSSLVADVASMRLAGPKSPQVLDWRLTEAVTPVKNQGACGSCWAFSVVETVESHFIIANADAYGVTLSPQQLVSCAGSFGALNCFGGNPKQAYAYIQSVPGLSNDWNWPYVESMTNFFQNVPNCSASKVQAINASGWQQQGMYAQISGYNWATPACNGTCDNQNLTALAENLELGPVSICLNSQIWQDYIGGVVTASACGDHSSSAVDHCVQLVGYNRSAEVPYWIVRNSWSTTWGEHGYIYLEMANNTCGLANEATIPVISNAPGAGTQRARTLFDRATLVTPVFTV